MSSSDCAYDQSPVITAYRNAAVSQLPAFFIFPVFIRKKGAWNIDPFVLTAAGIRIQPETEKKEQ